MPPSLSKPVDPKAPAAPSSAGSKRGRDAINTQKETTRSAEQVGAPHLFFVLWPGKAVAAKLQTRLQCDLSGPAKLDARIHHSDHHIRIGVAYTSNDVLIHATFQSDSIYNKPLIVPPSPDASQVEDDVPRAILVIKQTEDDGPRKKIPDGLVVAGLTAHCEDAKMDTTKPQYGFHSDSPTGPWKAYFDASVVDLILEAGNLLQLEVDGEQVVLEMRKKTIASLKAGKHTLAFLDSATVHVVVKIYDDVLLSHVTRQDLLDGWEQAGFLSVSDSRGGTYVDGKRIYDRGLDSNVFHFNIKPNAGQLLGSIFPEELKISVKGTPQFLPYFIDSHPDLEGRICSAASGCHRYFPETANWLNEESADRSYEYRKFYPACRGHAGVKRARSKAVEGKAALRAAVAAQAKVKSGIDCAHHLRGACRLQGKCKFAHTKPANEINCSLAKKAEGKCLLGDHCPYLHNEMSTDCKSHACPEPD
jgi:hypothetical protein